MSKFGRIVVGVCGHGKAVTEVILLVEKYLLVGFLVDVCGHMKDVRGFPVIR